VCEACRRNAPKDECIVKLKCPEKEWWAGMEVGLLRSYHLPGHVTESDESVDPGCMGAGLAWMDRSLESCGSERKGCDEDGIPPPRCISDRFAFRYAAERRPDRRCVYSTDVPTHWLGKGG
jgi:hypothetical protein